MGLYLCSVFFTQFSQENREIRFGDKIRPLIPNPFIVVQMKENNSTFLNFSFKIDMLFIMNAEKTVIKGDEPQLLHSSHDEVYHPSKFFAFLFCQQPRHVCSWRNIVLF